MKVIAKKFQEFLADEHGGNAIEYGLLAALIALVMAVGATTLGTALSTLFGAVATKTKAP